MIFSKRWYGIKGETIEPGSPYAMSVVRVQTSKDGAWNALTEKELDQLLQEHNALVHDPYFKPVAPKAIPIKVKTKKSPLSTKKKGKKK